MSKLRIRLTLAIEIVSCHEIKPDDYQFLCEQCYLDAPDIIISSQNSTHPHGKVTVTQVELTYSNDILHYYEISRLYPENAIV